MGTKKYFQRAHARMLRERIASERQQRTQRRTAASRVTVLKERSGPAGLAGAAPDEIPTSMTMASLADHGALMATVLGELVIVFGELDDRVSEAIVALLDRGDRVGRVVTDDLGFSVKVNLLRRLYRETRPLSDRLLELDELCNSCLYVARERSRIVHADWEGDGLHAEARTRLTFEDRDPDAVKPRVTMSRMRAVWSQCDLLREQLERLLSEELRVEQALVVRVAE